ncbi:hypothetical protein L2E82_29308 [Cichorium intybus]|uniref:Uncharacterized protein n=1 Tax=Cichorium intybus TaxID=13427 RepID=A0ACB9CXB6_CICIN|nr:hypothetical protein L2E82_29308 [Cichorium intybus]
MDVLGAGVRSWGLSEGLVFVEALGLDKGWWLEAFIDTHYRFYLLVDEDEALVEDRGDDTAKKSPFPSLIEEAL